MRSEVSLKLALAFALAVPLLWLNQSIGGAEWEAYKARVHRAPGADIVETLRYPTSFLYRRSGDEEIYFATANATLGRPYDREILEARGKSSLPPVTVPVDGRIHWPYREVSLEYLPPNFPFVVAPALATTTFRNYARLFSATMGALLLVAALVATRLAPRVGESSEAHFARRAVLFGVLCLAHGAIAVQRLDAIVALLVALLLHAAVHRRFAAFGLVAGLLAATKVVPALAAVPLFFAAVGTDALAAPLRKAVLFGLLGTALGLAPLALAPAALGDIVAYHGTRGLHVESTFGTLYGLVRLVTGRGYAAAMDFGSYNVPGPVAGALAKASSLVTLALVALAAFGARRASRDAASDEARRLTLVLATLAGLTALYLGGKVFSPQYLTWAIPVVLAAPHGRPGAPSPLYRLTFTLALVLGLSQLFLRGFYDHVYNGWPAGVITTSVRVVVLAVAFAALAHPPLMRRFRVFA